MPVKTKKPAVKSNAKTASRKTVVGKGSKKGATPVAKTAKSIIDARAEAFLFEYLNNASPVGFEGKGQQIWLNYLQPFIDDQMTDVYGNAVAVINPGQTYSVAIEAHADEISWFAKFITDDGYIYIERNGGSDHQIAPSMRVHLHGDKGIVNGIFGWPAIHVRDPMKEEQPSKNNLFIDVGAKDKAEVLAMGIRVGTVITYVDGLTMLNDKFYVGRALDNRMGGFMIAQVARQLAKRKIKLPYTLYVVNSVQEEIGLRGAEMISRRLKPNIAICTDMSHDTQSPYYNKRTQGDIACGRGPIVTTGPAVQNNLQKFITDIADKKKIPYQRQALARSTGTDTDSFAYSGEGVASALLSLPLKYMHTTVEMVNKDDVETTINLFIEVLSKLKGSENFRYL